MDNFVGKRLDGRYEIQEIIGVGGMSVVYKAYDNIDDRIVAVKILKDEFLANEEFRRRFKNESKAIAVLNHPNIVRVYDVNFGERLQYIVMEYVDGITLKEYIKQQGVVNWQDAVHFITQILRALQHAHDKGIVHRDIKPQNIILLQNGNIKVADFGIARFSRSDTRTMTEKAIGSVHYISPEQARGDMTDEKADIYSVGVVLYEILTGQVPFEADSAVSVAIMQLQADPKLPRSINPSIPIGLEQITMHAMQKVAAERYQTATEMLLDIDEFSRNPNATFDYSFFVDNQPTKFVSLPEDAQQNSDDYVERLEPAYDEYYEQDENANDDDTAKKKKMLAVICTGAVALIAAIVVLVMALTGSFGKGKETVPDFSGKVFETEIQGKYPNFKFEITTEASDLKVGSVISQDPKAKTKVKEGTTIKLVVAAETEEVVVPNVVGMTLTDAKALLKKNNLNNYEVIEAPSEDVDSGKVVSTSPGEKTSVDASTKITIYVSTGTGNVQANKLEMPDVSGLKKNDIKDYLVAAGFDLKSINITTEDSTKPEGTVLSQSPAKGTKILPTSTIKIVVSSGKTTTESTTTTAPVITEAKPDRVTTIAITLPKIDSSPRYTVIVKAGGDTISSETWTMDGKVQTLVVDKRIDIQDITIEIDGLSYFKVIKSSHNFKTGGTIEFSVKVDTTTEPADTKPVG